MVKTMNMERELELKDICGYLPHELLAKIKAGSERIYEVIAINGADSISLTSVRPTVLGFDEFDPNKIAPILRPLSDLYRTIMHNGKEIIPIVELAKIAEPNYVWKINKKMAIREIIYETWTDKVFFGYAGLHRYFKFTERDDRYFYSAYKDDNVEYIPDQIPLFDFMNELKIDYRGLIDAGLAIDANTLETNPYK
jgi:hypothetical protein